MKYVLTAAMLRERGATCSQVDAFEAEWPEGATPTKKNFLRAAALGLDLGWLAKKFLPSAAWAAYRKAAASAWNACDKAQVAAWAAYKKATARAAHEKAGAAYERAEAAAWDAYDRRSEAAAKATQNLAMALWRIVREVLAKGES